MSLRMHPVPPVSLPSTVIEGLTYRAVAPADSLDGVNDLFRRTFPDGYWQGSFAAYWRWVNGSPSGPGHLFTASDGDRVVGALSFLSERLIGHGGQYLGVQAGNAMTDPDYRRRGIYTNISHVAFESLAASGVDLVFGYTLNERVLQTEMKIGYRRMGDGVSYVAPLHLGRLLGHRLPALDRPWCRAITGRGLLRLGRWLAGRGLKEAAGVVVREVDRPPAEAEALAVARRDRRQYEILKDLRQLAWKYAPAPVAGGNGFRFLTARRQGRLLGFAVCGRREIQGAPGLAIYEVVTEPAAERPASLALGRRLVELAEHAGLALVACVADENGPLAPVLPRLGFVKTDHRFKGIIKVLNPALPETLQEASFWRHSWGAMDYF
ncbi:MAG: GNAT family N-acetyltransferase [Thermodesulfobacteriota bacterium]